MHAACFPLRNILSQRFAVLPAPSLWFVQEDVLELKRDLFISESQSLLQRNAYQCTMHDSSLVGAKVAYLCQVLVGEKKRENPSVKRALALNTFCAPVIVLLLQRYFIYSKFNFEKGWKYFSKTFWFTKHLMLFYSHLKICSFFKWQKTKW